MPKRERAATASKSDNRLLSRRDFVTRTSLIGAGLAIAQLAYEGAQGPELAYRIERFSK